MKSWRANLRCWWVVTRLAWTTFFPKRTWNVANKSISWTRDWLVRRPNRRKILNRWTSNSVKDSRPRTFTRLKQETKSLTPEWLKKSTSWFNRKQKALTSMAKWSRTTVRWEQRTFKERTRWSGLRKASVKSRTLKMMWIYLLLRTASWANSKLLTLN